MYQGIHIPLFGSLSSPRACMDIACAAQEYGWDGVFVWDHLFAPFAGEWTISDPWIVLAAMASCTHTIRLGPMVCPLPRYHIGRLAKETITLDHLSEGRLILGLGTGRDLWREYSAFGQDGSPKVLGRILDEGAQVLTQLWAGGVVDHHGSFIVDGAQISPGPVQVPHIPIWCGVNTTSGRPIHRAARYEGIYPTGFFDEMDSGRVYEVLDSLEQIRGNLDGFDVALGVRPGQMVPDDLIRAGVTWAMHTFWPGDDPHKVIEFIQHGPPRS